MGYQEVPRRIVTDLIERFCDPDANQSALHEERSRKASAGRQRHGMRGGPSPSPRASASPPLLRCDAAEVRRVVDAALTLVARNLRIGTQRPRAHDLTVGH